MSRTVRAFINNLSAGYDARVAEGLEFVGFFRNVASGGTVFLKPNLTFPEYRPGVMTSVECVKAVAGCLIERGYQVLIGEADSGGYNRFSMDAVFERTGLRRMATELGARIVNISFTEPEMITVRAGWRRLSVPVPRLLLREIDAFISMPVPKVHLNTGVSLSLKNQWGCIQNPAERLKLHPYFSEVIFELNRRLPRAHCIMDGRYGLNRSGPMRGDPVELGWLLVADDLVAADRIGAGLMQVPEEKIRHLRHFRSAGWWPQWQDIVANQSWERFRREEFRLERAWTDLPGLACFNSSFLAWLGYRSPLAGLAHWLLYLFREPFYDYEKEKTSPAQPPSGQP